MTVYNNTIGDAVALTEVLAVGTVISPSIMADTTVLVEVAIGSQSTSFRDSVAVQDSNQQYGRLRGQLGDVAVFAASVNLAYSALASDAVALSDTESYSYKAVSVAADIVLLTTDAPSRLHALAVVATAMVVGSSITPARLEALLDTAAFTSSASAALKFLTAMADSAALADNTAGSYRLLLRLEDSALVGDDVSQQSRLISQLDDGVVLFSLLKYRGEQYRVWAMSPDTEAVWKYENFNFNSYAKFGGQYYGANEDGLFLLEGDTDDGADISAYARTGLMDFGTGRLKQMSRAYLGYTASGALLLKVSTTASEGEFKGKKIEDWYELTRSQEAFREGRIPVGRGLSSVYWQFEISNKLGADFSIDGIKLYPLITDRRIK